MSRRLGPVAPREVVKRLRKLGFEGPRQGTNHDFMQKGQKKVRVSTRHNDDVGIDLLKNILKQAGISREEWFDAE